LLLLDRGLRAHFGAALTDIEREGGVDLVAHLGTVATCTVLSRLVRAQAITVLGAWASPVAIETLITLFGETDPVLRAAVDDALVTAGAEAVGPLRAAMTLGDDQLRARAAEVLSRGGAAALSAALASLDDAEAPVRAAAARTLGALGAAQPAGTASQPRGRVATTRRRDVEAGVDALHARLDDPSSTVRVASAWALGRIGSRRSVSILEAHLSKPDPDLRAAIAEAFGALHQTSTLDQLIKLLDDPDARVRASAAEALGRLGDKRAVTPLRKRLGDTDLWSKAAAAAALRLLGTQ
jgi:HEAT repeat protein